MFDKLATISFSIGSGMLFMQKEILMGIAVLGMIYVIHMAKEETE